MFSDISLIVHANVHATWSWVVKEKQQKHLTLAENQLSNCKSSSPSPLCRRLSGPKTVRFSFFNRSCLTQEKLGYFTASEVVLSCAASSFISEKVSCCKVSSCPESARFSRHSLSYAIEFLYFAHNFFQVLQRACEVRIVPVLVIVCSRLLTAPSSNWSATYENFKTSITTTDFNSGHRRGECKSAIVSVLP